MGKSTFGFRWLALSAIGCVVMIALAAGLRSLLDDGDDGGGGRSRELRVTPTSFDPWPFTVDQATLQCLDGQSITLLANGRRYGVNGTAQSRGFEPVDAVWREAPGVPGLRVDLAPVLSVGQVLCA